MYAVTLNESASASMHIIYARQAIVRIYEVQQTQVTLDAFEHSKLI